MKIKHEFLPVRLRTALCALTALLSFAVAPLASAANPPKITVSDQPIDRDAKQPASFSPIVKKISPCVVSVYTTHNIKLHPYRRSSLDDSAIRRFFGYDSDEGEDNHIRTFRQQGLGSGVVISEDGYLITNSHVVSEADEIKVSLGNDKTEYTAKVIGTDPRTDIAILKIDAKDLKAITLADSDKVEVGDVVLAVGNPRGVGQSVSKGIVSAVGRNGLGIIDYEDFIQTDAAINPGNSGGALVDIQGRLVGINQSIVSTTGGSQGIGLAVPVNTIRSVLNQLVADGRITHGYLGVYIQPVTPDLAKEFKLPNQNGALVGQVQPETPAAQAGLKEGDAVIEFNGKEVRDPRHFKNMVAQSTPKAKVSLKIVRDGTQKDLTAIIGELPSESSRGPSRDQDEKSIAKTGSLEGVDISDIDNPSRRQFGIPREVRGALVTKVAEDSAAAEAGLRPGDVIMAINHKAVDSADATEQLAQNVKNGRLLLRVWSKVEGVSATRFIVLQTGKQE